MAAVKTKNMTYVNMLLKTAYTRHGGYPKAIEHNYGELQLINR